MAAVWVTWSWREWGKTAYSKPHLMPEGIGSKATGCGVVIPPGSVVNRMATHAAPKGACRKCVKTWANQAST
jgi:hypothetical protein